MFCLLRYYLTLVEELLDLSGENISLKEKEVIEDVEKYVMKNFLRKCTFHLILFWWIVEG
jgi:hypothetical protein